MSAASVIGEVASVATAVGVLGAFASISTQTRARKFDLAQAYIARYWAIDDDIRLLHASTTPTVDPKVHEQRYLRLCEDEYELARLGWISDRVWREWHSAIREQAKHYLPSTPPTSAVEYTRLVGCLNDPHPDHEPYDCPGVSDRTWVRRTMWRLERMTGG